MLIRLGGHQAVELCILGEVVGKGHQIAGAANQTATSRHVGDVPQLGVRDVQQFGQLLPVGGALVEHDQEFRVGQHQAGRIGAQQFVYILRHAGDQTVVLADALPEFVEEIGAVLVPEQDVELVAEDPGSVSTLPVLNHTVVDGVQRHQYSEGHQLFAQFADIVGDDARLGIHVGRLGKGAQRAGDEEFRGEGQALCFRFRLHLEQTVEVFQRGDCALVPVADIGHIDLLRAAAQDGFFLGGDQPAADQLLKQAQDKFAFGHNGVPLITIGAVHIQRVDVGVGSGRNADDLAAEGFH